VPDCTYLQCLSGLPYTPVYFGSGCLEAVVYTTITARSELRKVLFLAPSVCVFLFVYEMSQEPLNGFAPNSQGRRVWSLTRMSLMVKVKGQGYYGQKQHFWPFGGLCAVYFW